MNNFKETQRFNQWWIWAIIIGSLLFSISIISYVNYKKFGVMFEPNLEALYSIGVGIAVLLLLLIIKLETKISSEAVEVRFYPVNLRWKIFAWTEIEEATVRTYKPMLEYGGWGIKGTKSNRAYSVYGKSGLQLKVGSNKILIGTNQTVRLEQFLTYLKSKHQITCIETEN